MTRARGGRLRRTARPGLVASVVFFVCLAAGSLALALYEGGGGSPAGAKQTLSVKASLSSRSILFGDTVEARLDLTVPRGTKPGEVKTHPVFSPFRVVSRRVDRVDLGGGLERMTLRYGLTCLSLHCLDRHPSRRVQFGPTTVSIPGRSVRAVWPALVQSSRVQAVSAPVVDGLESGSAVSPGLQPRRDAYEALGAAGFSLVTLLSAWFYLRRRARRRLAAQARAPSVLQALLARVEAGLPEDVLYRQRHTLDALAVELRHRRIDSGLALRAERLAWAPEQPDPEEIRSLCGQIRSAVKT